MGTVLLKSNQSIPLSVSFYAAVSGQCDWAGGFEQVAASCEGRGFFSQHRDGDGVWLLVWVTNNCFFICLFIPAVLNRLILLPAFCSLYFLIFSLVWVLGGWMELHVLFQVHDIHGSIWIPVCPLGVFI